MKKTFSCLVIISIIILVSVLPVNADFKAPSLYLDDKPVKFSIPIKNLYGRLYVPSEEFFSAVRNTKLYSQNQISYNSSTHKLTSKTADTNLVLKSRRFYGKDYILLRTAAEFVGFKISWNNALKRAYLKTPKNYVVVLAYGNIVPEKQKQHYLGESFVTLERFKTQMDYLHKQGYKTLTLKDLRDYLQGKKSVDKGVILTFDGAYSNFYMYAYPIIKKYNYHGIVFVETTSVGRSSRISYMGWNRLKQMAKEGVIEVNSLTHNMYKFEGEAYRIIRTRPSEIIKDLKISRQLIKILVEKEADALAYPHGIYNDAIITYAKQAGFTLGFTTKRGYINPGDNTMTLKRNFVYDWMDLEYFKTILEK